MSAQQIQALLTGAIVLLLGWQLGKTLVSGEVTISLNGRGAKRGENARLYWTWTAILAVFWLVILIAFIGAATHLKR